ncbi:nitroreductase family protein [Methanobrevibacter sp. 87.7]|uniref:nitroreductase family protein n=1 Tax=Methanobrevibacter sp. 87.7 TaxID=387957 RepID=UPI001E5F90D6|nr:nitroreductase family protein [Methanobrevibacter sp. 87.7]
MDIMLKRRSIRKYTDEDISDDKIEKIIDAGLLAPSSRNRKPCEFIVIKNKDMLEKLSHAKAAGSKMLANANTAIAVFADSNKADTWVEDASIALTYMDLMAVNLGIGTCWTQMHLRFSKDDVDSEEFVRNLLSIEDKYRIVGILSLGIPSENKNPHDLNKLDKDKVKYIL